MILSLNPSQVRNMRNWPEVEWPAKTVIIVLDGRRLPAGRVIGAIRQVAVRHEAMRSRLDRRPDGVIVQEVQPAVRFDLRYCSIPAGEVALDLHDREPLDPFIGAFRVTLYTTSEAVRHIKICTSHFFADAVGVEVIANELSALLTGDTVEPDPKQARSYAPDPGDPALDEHAAVWRDLLRDMPRSCTYTPMRRRTSELRQFAGSAFGDVLTKRVDQLCEDLRTTPYLLWVTAGSVLVSALSRTHRQVYRSTYANRYSAADFGAVAQLAQAVFVPIAGDESDTLEQRLAKVSETFWATYEHGFYHAHELVTWLNSSAGFQPAFEVNFLPRSAVSSNCLRPPVTRPREVEVAFDPVVPRADLAIDVTYLPDIVLEVQAGRGITANRDANALVSELTAVLDCFLSDPSMKTADVPIDPLPSVRRLVAGHPSGVMFDLDVTEEMIRAVHGVTDVVLEVERGPDATTLSATVSTRDAPSAAELWRRIRERQPWYAGSVVPDRLTARPGLVG